MKLRVALAQVNPTVGDLVANAALVRENFKTAQDAGAHIVVFPEMVLTGYPVEDLALRPSFQAASKSALATLAQEINPEIVSIVGYLDHLDGRPQNMVAVIAGGEVRARYAKCHLPNYGVFDEKRYFTPSSETNATEFRGTKLGVMICEDMWFENIANDLKRQGAEILISINGSPFEIGKLTARELQARARVNETNLPLIYVNQIGGQDDLVFDGTSFILDKNGKEILTCKSFEEDVRTHSSSSECIPSSFEKEELLFRASSLGLKDYLRKTGQKKVLIGLSGGVDSALAAAIAVDAIGAENIHAVMMPSEFTSQESLDDAALCAKNLGITYEITPIKNMVETFTKDQPETTGLAHENLQSRLRGVILMTKSNMTGAMVVTTGNKSEMAMGYATLYGDMCGGYNPLKDMYKVEVYKICEWYNKTHSQKIPENIITKAPSAELRPDQKDQDSLPPYDTLDAILECLIEKDLSVTETSDKGFDKDTVKKVARLLKIAQYKRNQSAPGPKLTQRAFARERRYPISNGYKG